MLNFQQLSAQLSGLSAHQLQEQPRIRDALLRAQDALADLAPCWSDQPSAALAESVPWLMAKPRQNPARAWETGARPTPITVVAADGSQIYPDRHIEPFCYLLNISQIAFQYGVTERPLLESLTHFNYRFSDLSERFESELGGASADVVAAQRDEMELEGLLAIAKSARVARRPMVALADGTLIRWMLHRIDPPALKRELIGRYATLLSYFREERIPLCSFISMPNATEVVNLLRGLSGEKDHARATSFAGLLDRWVFEPRLMEGRRTAVFESSSRIQDSYDPEDRICFFYVSAGARRPPAEIARVEFPSWVADDAALLSLMHTVVLSECEKGDGYPMILSEAHERAVIRSDERQLFYRLVEREMARSGLSFARSRKQQAKRRPVV